MATSNNTLGITVTSNVGGALPGINNVTGGLNGMAGAAGAATTAINRLAPAFQQHRGLLQTFIGQARAGQLSLQGLNGAASELGPALQRGARPATNATNALTNLGRVASDLPFGFIAIQNNLDPLISSFGLVFSSAGGLREGFKALRQALVGPAGIGLAFSVVSSATTVLIQKYGSLGNAIQALNPFLSNAAKGQAAWNAALATSAGPASKEIANVELLYEATQDLNIPLEERRKIANELIKQYPQSFKGLTDEKILAGQAAAAYEELTQSLLAAATVKAASSFIEENIKGLIGLRIEATKLNQRLAELRAPDTGFISEDPLSVDRKINAVQNEINKNKAKQRVLEEQNAAIQSEQLNLVKQYGAEVLITNQQADTKVKKEKAVKTELDKQSEVIKALRENVISLDAAFIAQGGTIEDLTNDKIKAFGKALGDLTNLGAGPGTAIFDNIRRELQSLRNVATQTAVTIKIPIKVEPIQSATNRAAIEGIAKGLNDDFSRAFQSANDKAMAALLESGIENGIATIAEGLGKAFTGGGFDSVFDGFINAIANFGESLGKQLIATGISLEAFKTSLASLSGVQAVAAGAALIAASAAFRSLAKGGLPSFATGGGIVGGPQLAMIGDNPGREEYVIPSEVLNTLGGGAGYIAETRVSINELLIALKRADRNG